MVWGSAPFGFAPLTALGLTPTGSATGYVQPCGCAKNETPTPKCWPLLESVVFYV